MWYLPSRALVKKCISGGLLEAAGQIRRCHPQQPGQRWQIFLPRKKLIIRSTTQTEIGHISYFTRRYLNEVGAKYCYCRNNDPVDKKLLDFCNLASFDLPGLLLRGGTDGSDGKMKCYPWVVSGKSIYLPFFPKWAQKRENWLALVMTKILVAHSAEKCWIGWRHSERHQWHLQPNIPVLKWISTWWDGTPVGGGGICVLCRLAVLALHHGKSCRVLLETTLMFLSGRIIFMILTENYD